jgi:hypothetical protein
MNEFNLNLILIILLLNINFSISINKEKSYKMIDIFNCLDDLGARSNF